MAKPWEFCSSGRLSATKARKGCMLALMVPSSTHNSPAAIQTDGQFGIRTSASDARIAPPRINGRRRPNRVQSRSLDWPIKGWMITPVTGAASHKMARESGSAPR